jgi:hypothetical protein
MNITKLTQKEWAKLGDLFSYVLRDEHGPLDSIAQIDMVSPKMAIRETFIRVGPLLIGGDTSLKKVLVFTPMAGLVNVTLTQEGPWWGVIRELSDGWWRQMNDYLRLKRKRGGENRQQVKEAERAKQDHASLIMTGWIESQQGEVGTLPTPTVESPQPAPVQEPPPEPQPEVFGEPEPTATPIEEVDLTTATDEEDGHGQKGDDDETDAAYTEEVEQLKLERAGEGAEETTPKELDTDGLSEYQKFLVRKAKGNPTALPGV